MNKIINGVASEYDMPMKYENKSTTIFIDTQDMEERYGEQLYQEYLEAENKKLKQKLNQLETNRDEVIEYIKSNPNVLYDEYLIDVETLLENERTDEIAGEIRFISTLLSILERGKENE